MDGIHDLGGRQGFGPIDAPQGEPTWHSDWEKTAFTMFPAMALAGAFNVDQFRHAMEKIAPVDYLSARYYEHWLHSFEGHGVAAGIFDEAELERRTEHYLTHPDEPLPEPAEKPDLVPTLEGLVTGGISCHRDTETQPQFKIGAKVRVREGASTKHHTRRAGYVRGRVGEIVLQHGAYVFPDDSALGRPENPQHVYTLRFSATELWGPDHPEANEAVYFDAWEPYLESA